MNDMEPRRDSKQIFVLGHDTARQRASRAVLIADQGSIVTIEPQRKSRDQEAMYHAIFGEISKTRTFMGRKWDLETWKRLLVDAFARVKAAEGEPIQGYGSMIPSLDGTGFVQLGVQTRRFTKAQASEFIEFLHAWMADQEAVA